MVITSLVVGWIFACKPFKRDCFPLRRFHMKFYQRTFINSACCHIWYWISPYWTGCFVGLVGGCQPTDNQLTTICQPSDGHMGQVVTSRKSLATELKLSEREIRTALTHLKTTNDIAIETTTKFSIITVISFDDYQGATNTSTNERPSSDQRATTPKELKNNKILFSSEIAEIVAYLNSKIGTRYKPTTANTKKHISTRHSAIRLPKIVRSAPFCDFLRKISVLRSAFCANINSFALI